MSEREPVPQPVQGRTRRRFLVLLAGVGVAAASAGGVALVRGPRRPAAPAKTPPKTAAVVRTDLVDRVRVDGTLGYVGSVPVTGHGGTITWLPEPGSTVARGQAVYRVDDRPVPLFYGAIPIWRTLRQGCSGSDVRQLQANLAALGHTGSSDGQFGAGTAAALRRWWLDQGRSGLGSIGPGDVVVAPGPIRVGAVSATVGLPASGPVLTATGTGRQVTVSLPVGQQQEAIVGAAVTVELPTGVTATGRVASVGTVATAGAPSGASVQVGQAAQSATVPVQINLDRPEVAGRLDGAPVTVGFTSAVRRGVLAVPVDALLAQAADSYAVAVIDQDGSRRLVPVRLGLFADGQVEVSGAGLTAGDRVEVPSG